MEFDRQAIFGDDRDRTHFLELLAEFVDRYGVRVHAFVLMDNHYHLLAQIREANLSAAMQWLGDSYAMWFNRRHRRVGPLYQGRFKAILIDGEVYAAEVSRYLHLNPVRVKREGLDKAGQQAQRAGIIERPADAGVLTARLEKLRRYRWSSYLGYIGKAAVPAWQEGVAVLRLLGVGADAAGRRAYQRFVEELVREGLAESPWEKLVGGVVLGGGGFLRRVRRWVGGDAGEQPSLKAVRVRVPFERVVEVVEQAKGEGWSAFRDRHGDWGRELVWYLARRHCGLTLRELGARAGGARYSAVSEAIRRLGRRLEKDRRFRGTVRQAERELLKIQT